MDRRMNVRVWKIKPGRRWWLNPRYRIRATVKPIGAEEETLMFELMNDGSVRWRRDER